MKKFASLYLVLLLGLGLVGCATGYARRGFTGGYSDMKLQDDIYRVAFNGNAYCGGGRAEDFTLLRCAELTLEQGYKYFVIIDEKSGIATSSYTTPIATGRNVTVIGNSASYSSKTTYSGGQTYTFSKPSTCNTIKCFKEKPDISTMVYDAVQVERNLKNAYGIKN
ncbi:MAG: hypothetical protein V1933_08465 [Candidatus Omnitrophota bacterium]